MESVGFSWNPIESTGIHHNGIGICYDVHPILGALNTRNPRVICNTLKIIQLIATCSKESGRAFLPYYKSLLPVLNLFKIINRNDLLIHFSRVSLVT